MGSFLIHSRGMPSPRLSGDALGRGRGLAAESGPQPQGCCPRPVNWLDFAPSLPSSPPPSFPPWNRPTLNGCRTGGFRVCPGGAVGAVITQAKFPSGLRLSHSPFPAKRGCRGAQLSARGRENPQQTVLGCTPPEQRAQWHILGANTLQFLPWLCLSVVCSRPPGKESRRPQPELPGQDRGSQYDGKQTFPQGSCAGRSRERPH